MGMSERVNCEVGDQGEDLEHQGGHGQERVRRSQHVQGLVGATDLGHDEVLDDEADDQHFGQVAHGPRQPPPAPPPGPAPAQARRRPRRAPEEAGGDGGGSEEAGEGLGGSAGEGSGEAPASRPGSLRRPAREQAPGRPGPGEIARSWRRATPRPAPRRSARRTRRERRPGRNQSRRAPAAPRLSSPRLSPRRWSPARRATWPPATVTNLARRCSGLPWPAARPGTLSTLASFVGRLAGIAGRTHPRRAAQRLHFDPGVLGDGRHARRLDQCPGLEAGVTEQGVLCFLDLPDARRPVDQLDPEVTGGEDLPVSRAPCWGWSWRARRSPAQPRIGDPRGSRAGGGVATTSACATSSRLIPLSARASMMSSSVSGERGAFRRPLHLDQASCARS